MFKATNNFPKAVKNGCYVKDFGKTVSMECFENPEISIFGADCF